MRTRKLAGSADVGKTGDRGPGIASFVTAGAVRRYCLWECGKHSGNNTARPVLACSAHVTRGVVSVSVGQMLGSPYW